MVKCPYPNCNHWGETLTNHHCMSAHGMSKKDVLHKYNNSNSQADTPEVAVATKKSTKEKHSVSPVSKSITKQSYKSCFTVDKSNLLIDNHPELVRQWDRVRNSTYDINMITAGSNIAVWWKCECGHEWKRSVKDRTTRGCGCIRCAARAREMKKKTG